MFEKFIPGNGSKDQNNPNSQVEEGNGVQNLESNRDSGQEVSSQNPNSQSQETHNDHIVSPNQETQNGGVDLSAIQENNNNIPQEETGNNDNLNLSPGSGTQTQGGESDGFNSSPRGAQSGVNSPDSPETDANQFQNQQEETLQQGNGIEDNSTQGLEVSPAQNSNTEGESSGYAQEVSHDFSQERPQDANGGEGEENAPDSQVNSESGMNMDAGKEENSDVQEDEQAEQQVSEELAGMVDGLSESSENDGDKVLHEDPLVDNAVAQSEPLKEEISNAEDELVEKLRETERKFKEKEEKVNTKKEEAESAREKANAANEEANKKEEEHKRAQEEFTAAKERMEQIEARKAELNELLSGEDNTATAS